MKQILAFGDSLTWGSDPHTGGRHPYDDRWPVALGEGLTKAAVFAEGLRGRTTVHARNSACRRCAAMRCCRCCCTATRRWIWW